MTRRLATPILLIALAGCAFTPPPDAIHADGRPLVSEGRAVHAVRYPAGLTVLATTELAALEAFLDAAGARPGDRVTLLVPGGREAVEARRHATLGELLAARGLRVAAIDDPEPRPGLLRVAVDRTVGRTAGCPDWTQSPLSGWRNATRPGFGCASAANLAAMVARPGDLAGGDDPGPARLPDPARSGRISNAPGSPPAPAGGGGTSPPAGSR